MTESAAQVALLTVPSTHTAASVRDWEAFIAAEVLCKQDDTVEGYQAIDTGFFDDVQNSHVVVCPCCEASWESLEKQDGSHDSPYFCRACEQGFFRLKWVTKEIKEWWQVSDTLAKQLAAIGEAVFHGPDFMVWGRCVSGQAIELDGTIQEAVRGRNWSWSAAGSAN